MKLLVDANLSAVVTDALHAAGYEAVHVREVGLGDSDDETIFE